MLYNNCSCLSPWCEMMWFATEIVVDTTSDIFSHHRWFERIFSVRFIIDIFKCYTQHTRTHTNVCIYIYIYNIFLFMNGAINALYNTLIHATEFVGLTMGNGTPVTRYVAARWIRIWIKKVLFIYPLTDYPITRLPEILVDRIWINSFSLSITRYDIIYVYICMYNYIKLNIHLYIYIYTFK